MDLSCKLVQTLHESGSTDVFSYQTVDCIAQTGTWPTGGKRNTSNGAVGVGKGTKGSTQLGGVCMAKYHSWHNIFFEEVKTDFPPKSELVWQAEILTYLSPSGPCGLLRPGQAEIKKIKSILSFSRWERETLLKWNNTPPYGWYRLPSLRWGWRGLRNAPAAVHLPSIRETYKVVKHRRQIEKGIQLT